MSSLNTVLNELLQLEHSSRLHHSLVRASPPQGARKQTKITNCKSSETYWTILKIKNRYRWEAKWVQYAANIHRKLLKGI